MANKYIESFASAAEAAAAAPAAGGKRGLYAVGDDLYFNGVNISTILTAAAAAAAFINNIPTADPLADGVVWNNSGTLTLSAGSGQ